MLKNISRFIYDTINIEIYGKIIACIILIDFVLSIIGLFTLIDFVIRKI